MSRCDDNVRGLKVRALDCGSAATAFAHGTRTGGHNNGKKAAAPLPLQGRPDGSPLRRNNKREARTTMRTHEFRFKVTVKAAVLVAGMLLAGTVAAFGQQ